MISYNEAYQHTLEYIHALEAEDVPLISAINRACAHDLYGQVNSPSADVSLKDGDAVHSDRTWSLRRDFRYSFVSSVASAESLADDVFDRAIVKIPEGKRYFQRGRLLKDRC